MQARQPSQGPENLPAKVSWPNELPAAGTDFGTAQAFWVPHPMLAVNITIPPHPALHITEVVLLWSDYTARAANSDVSNCLLCSKLVVLHHEATDKHTSPSQASLAMNCERTWHTADSR